MQPKSLQSTESWVETQQSVISFFHQSWTKR